MHIASIPTASIAHMDAFSFMETIPDHSIDIICTDPPYNLRQYSTGNIHAKWRSSFQNDIDTWDEKPFDPSQLVVPFKRILKPTGTIFSFAGYNQIGLWHSAFDSLYDTFQVVVWHKTNPPPKLRRQGFLNSCEFVVVLWNKGHHWNFTRQNEMHNFIESPICMGKERLTMVLSGEKHKTQKPLKVVKHLLNFAAHSDATVLDPFMGVGTTAEAALQLGMTFMGCDNDEDSYLTTAKRLGITI